MVANTETATAKHAEIAQAECDREGEDDQEEQVQARGRQLLHDALTGEPP